MGGEGEGRGRDRLHHLAGRQAQSDPAAEAQARSGHDILSFLAWATAAEAENLEPVDDIMAPLIAQNGKISPGIELSPSRRVTGLPCRQAIAWAASELEGFSRS
jgi:hypothetical protein